MRLNYAALHLFLIAALGMAALSASVSASGIDDPALTAMTGTDLPLR